MSEFIVRIIDNQTERIAQEHTNCTREYAEWVRQNTEKYDQTKTVKVFELVEQPNPRNDRQTKD